MVDEWVDGRVDGWVDGWVTSRGMGGCNETWTYSPPAMLTTWPLLASGQSSECLLHQV